MAPVSFVLFAHRATRLVRVREPGARRRRRPAGCWPRRCAAGSSTASGRAPRSCGSCCRRRPPTSSSSSPGTPRLPAACWWRVAFVAGAIIAPAGAARAQRVVGPAAPTPSARQAGYALIGMLQRGRRSWPGPLVAGGDHRAVVDDGRGRDRRRAQPRQAGSRSRPRRPRAAARPQRQPSRERLDARRRPADRADERGGVRRRRSERSTSRFPAFARDHGSGAAAGVLLSALAAGIGTGSFLVGLRPWPPPPGRRYPALCLLAAAGLPPLTATPSLAVMILLAFVAGLCFAPVTTCPDRAARRRRAARAPRRGVHLAGMLYGAGSAAGAALGGQLGRGRRAPRRDRRRLRGHRRRLGGRDRPRRHARGGSGRA